MAKDYTWFKFKIPDWMMGRIQKQKPEVRGVFLNLACRYWQKQCKLSIKEAKDTIDEVEYAYDSLLKKEIIKEIGEMVVIDFLDEQWAENEHLAEGRSKGGRASAAKRATQFTPENPTQVNNTSTDVNTSSTDVEICSSNREIDKNEIDIIPNGIVGLAPPTPTSRPVSFAERCNKFIQKFNELRESKFQATDNVKGKLKARLKNYSSVQIIEALKRAKNDEYHIKTNFKHLTPEYILRADILERFLNMPDLNTGINKGINTNNVSN
jgi:hypothetical protein